MSLYTVHSRNIADQTKGVYRVSSDGMVLWANPAWYSMTGHGREPKDHYQKSFYDFIDPIDHPLMDRKWNDIIVGKVPITFEFRTVQPWVSRVNGEMVSETRWILAQALPEFDGNGSVKNVVGITADISSIKYAETLQARSRVEAEEGNVFLKLQSAHA